MVANSNTMLRITTPKDQATICFLTVRQTLVSIYTHKLESKTKETMFLDRKVSMEVRAIGSKTSSEEMVKSHLWAITHSIITLRTITSSHLVAMHLRICRVMVDSHQQVRQLRKVICRWKSVKSDWVCSTLLQHSCRLLQLVKVVLISLTLQIW